jgi:hypothetical protein
MSVMLVAGAGFEAVDGESNFSHFSGLFSSRCRNRRTPASRMPPVYRSRRMILVMSPSSEVSLQDDPLSGLTQTQRAWAERSECLWRQAYAIAARHPNSDASDLYHALRCLQLTPSQRLAAGLQRGRLRAHAR